MGSLEPVADVSAADWIAERLVGPVGTVSSVVPGGYAAYARVLHPVEFHDDGEHPPTTWARVCEVTGRVAHALAQWDAIARPAGRSASPWDDGDAAVGSLAPDALAALVEALAPFTGDQDCYHALWEGWGWVDGSGVTVVAFTDGGTAVPPPPVVPGVPPEVWALPRLRLPHRDHLLFRGPLRAALDMGWHSSPLGFEPQSPALFWPADRTWCAGTEIDFDSTLVGGSAELVEAVLAAPGLEAWPVGPGDSLTADADRINTS